MIKCQRTSGWHATKGENSMFKMRKMIGVLVAVLFVFGSLGTTTMAAENPTIEGNGFKIVKYLQIDKNVEDIPKLQFDFKIQQLTKETDFKAAIPDGIVSDLEAKWGNISTTLVSLQQGTVIFEMPVGGTVAGVFGATESTTDHENLYEKKLVYCKINK